MIWVRLHVGTHGPCVRSSKIEGIYAGLLGRTHEPCVPTSMWTILSFNPIENQQFTPCIRNSPILHAEISGFAFKSGRKEEKQQWDMRETEGFLHSNFYFVVSRDALF